MKIGVWYHCLIAGARIPSAENSIGILSEQMNALNQSGLAEVADEIHIGFNGTDTDALTVCEFIPAKSILHVNPNGESELATLRTLREWLNPGWAVLYHHIKGVTYPNNEVWNRWRRCMERVCVWNWIECVNRLESGADTTGAHWMRNSRCNIIPKGQKYWGGNFWWASSDYLMKLPPLAADSHANRYEAEVWIGKSPAPVFIDFAPHFPMKCPQ